MVLLNMLHEIRHLNLLSAIITLNLALWTNLTVLINLSHFVFSTAVVLTDHVLQADQFLCKFVEHNVDIRTSAGRACFLVIFYFKRAYIAQELSAAAAPERL